MGIAIGKRRRTLLAGTTVAIGGALVGAIAAASVSASAATTGAGASAATAAVSSPSATASSGPGDQWHGGMASAGQHPSGFGLNLTGTVTSVGTSTVTIKTSSGAIKTYTVNASSDIDKTAKRNCHPSLWATRSATRCAPAPAPSTSSTRATRRRMPQPTRLLRTRLVWRLRVRARGSLLTCPRQRLRAQTPAPNHSSRLS